VNRLFRLQPAGLPDGSRGSPAATPGSVAEFPGTLEGCQRAWISARRVLAPLRDAPRIYYRLVRGSRCASTARLNGLVDDVILAPGTNVTFTTRANTLIISAEGGATNLVVTNGPPSGWNLTGNAGTAPGVNFVGTSDNQPVEFWVNNVRALRLEPTADDASHFNIVNVVGGSPANYIASGVYGSVIAGGGALSYFGVAQTNSILADGSFLGGGWHNSIQTNASYSVLAGGAWNSIQTNAHGSFLVGGYRNAIGASAFDSFVGGGLENSISAGASSSVLGGGEYNSIQSTARAAFLGSGGNNTNAGAYAVVPGGRNNSANGNYSFAAGRRAKALYDGDFVWADSQDGDFGATAPNQFVIRAVGGVGIGAPPGDALLDVTGNMRLNDYDLFLRAGSDRNHGLGWYGGTKTFASQAPDGPVLYGHGGGLLATTRGGVPNWTLQWTPDGDIFVRATVNATTFNPTCDRDQKENFTPVDSQEVLERVSALPITRWNFKQETAPHLGPMAQDFYAAFGLGTDDKHIATVDADGVALAAIQGLDQKLKERDAEIQALKQRLEALEKLVSQLTSK